MYYTQKKKNSKKPNLKKDKNLKNENENNEKYHNQSIEEKSKNLLIHIMLFINLNIINNNDIQIKTENLEKTIEIIPKNIKKEIDEQKRIINEIYNGLTENNVTQSIKILNKFKPIINDLYNLCPEFEFFSDL